VTVVTVTTARDILIELLHISVYSAMLLFTARC